MDFPIKNNDLKTMDQSLAPFLGTFRSIKTLHHALQMPCWIPVVVFDAVCGEMGSPKNNMTNGILPNNSGGLNVFRASLPNNYGGLIWFNGNDRIAIIIRLTVVFYLVVWNTHFVFSMKSCEVYFIPTHELYHSNVCFRGMSAEPPTYSVRCD